MGFKTRNIELTYGGEQIEFSANADPKTGRTYAKLLVNGKALDELISTPWKGIFGCRLTLAGRLSSGANVKVEILANFFRRPFYTLYIDNQVIHQEKGTWGGL